MQLVIRGIISEIFRSEKSGKDYVTVVDQDGGIVKFAGGDFDWSKMPTWELVEISGTFVATSYNGRQGLRCDGVQVKAQNGKG